MCGIVGIWHLDGAPLDPVELDRFTDSLVHRGPDGRGIYVDPETSLGLGHRRLAILDLSPDGRQPMSYANGRYWITFNGEIYNFIELREELTALGYDFSTDSDTEVILAAFVQWGEDCQLRFNGMWAFAIWDSRERVLFLSRDRFGVKPLHYFFDGKVFAFASELKAFLHINEFPLDFDPEMVATAAINAVIIEADEDTLLRGIKHLIGGHCLTLRQGQSPRIRRWWNTLEHLETLPVDSDQQVERFRELFFDACNIRMRSDVPLGTALSGGLDSSSVLCAMADVRSQAFNGRRHAVDWQKAFVATFPDTVQDEREYAEEVVRYTGTIPVYKEIESMEVIKHLDDVLFQFEEIFDIPSSVWLLYREQRRQGVVVSMDGHGGDELLAGYSHYLETAMLDALCPRLRSGRLLELRTAFRNLYPKGKAPEGFDLQMPQLTDLTRWLSKLRTLYPEGSFLNMSSGVLGVFGEIVNGQSLQRENQHPWLRVQPRSAHFPDFLADQPMLSNFDVLNRQLYFDFHFQTLPTILRNFDRCSMAHGVEIRAPFMDWRLVCMAFALPSERKLAAGFTKYILREAMRGVLPEPIRIRMNKFGFVSPLTDWLKGEMKMFVMDSVNSQAFCQSEIWNGPVIRDFAEKSHVDGNHKALTRVWSYVHAMRLMQLFHHKRSTNETSGSN